MLPCVMPNQPSANGSRKVERVPTVASFFSGIGGFELGFERAGFYLTLQCEIDALYLGRTRSGFPGRRLL